MARIRIRMDVAAAVLALTLGAGHQAFAASDISGSWKAFNDQDSFERGSGAALVDYTGLALNAEGKALALATDLSRQSTIERQCVGWGPYYIATGFWGLRIWSETDPLSGLTKALHIGSWDDRPETVIYLDGRPHPSANAPHTRAGFWTGKWRGATLSTKTTHMKMNGYRRNGAQTSDQATVTGHFIRRGNWLTVVTFVDDPVYFSDTQSVTRDFELKTGSETISTGPPCLPGYQGAEGVKVAHYLPGANPAMDELKELYGLPREVALGGAETMYPEYRKKLKAIYVRPEKCEHNCGGDPSFGPPPAAPAPPAPAGAPRAPAR